MKTEVYLIQPFTNMHVGSGKENSGIVDNMVQRDVLTNYPVINSTSLKGALKEYFDKVRYRHQPNKDAIIEKVFGIGNKKIEGQEDDKLVNIPGKFNFFSANLLSIPARSDKFPFLNATSPQIIEDLLKQFSLLENIIDDKTIEAFNCLLSFKNQEGAICFDPDLENAVVEFYNVKAQLRNISNDQLLILKKWIGENIVLVDNKIFKNEIVGKLPIIARNHLNNGQSANLWYEEIVPRESRFYTFISAREDDWDSIDFNIRSIQIGGNSSVGYGFSSIYQVKYEGGV